MTGSSCPCPIWDSWIRLALRWQGAWSMSACWVVFLLATAAFFEDPLQKCANWIPFLQDPFCAFETGLVGHLSAQSCCEHIWCSCIVEIRVRLCLVGSHPTGCQGIPLRRRTSASFRMFVLRCAPAI